MNYFSLFINFVPPTVTGNSNNQMGKGNFFKSKANVEAVRLIKSHLDKNIPKEPLSGVVEIKLTYIFPLLKSDMLTKKAIDLLNEYPYIYHNKKPDIDNIQKTLFDEMCKKGYIENDSRISLEDVAKFRGKKTGLYIEAREIEARITEDQFERRIKSWNF